MAFNFKSTLKPSPWSESWSRALTISGERGSLSIALALAHPKGERISLAHHLRRADVVHLSESLKAWLDSPDSYPPCHEPGCKDPSMADSDFCPIHQD